jgi:hypothetical protein
MFKFSLTGAIACVCTVGVSLGEPNPVALSTRNWRLDRISPLADGGSIGFIWLDDTARTEPRDITKVPDRSELLIIGLFNPENRMHGFSSEEERQRALGRQPVWAQLPNKTGRTPVDEGSALEMELLAVIDRASKTADIKNREKLMRLKVLLQKRTLKVPPAYWYEKK